MNGVHLHRRILCAHRSPGQISLISEGYQGRVQGMQVLASPAGLVAAGAKFPKQVAMHRAVGKVRGGVSLQVSIRLFS